MFERTLQDLIRGLRAHKASSKAQEDAFLQEAMVELKEELKGKDMALKAEGVLKMCYLMMLYPIPPPPGFAFHVVEVMSSPRYHLKQLGYMAAPMAFSGETEEVVLTVNGIKKDLMSPHLAFPPLPLTALPHLLALSPSLSHTLHPDLLHLLTHSSPRIRKRAVLCLLPCWEAFPEGLREGFPRLRDRLSDEDQGVVGATVGVVMELARRQGGTNYLPLAPELFGILTGSSNNWMLIKVVKLFAILTPLEPRLVRKLLPPITNLISSTSAISLLYECVRTCIVGGMLDPDRPEADALARVCVEKLGGYLRDEGGDQNLRYIALLAMVKIIPTHPAMIAEYQDEILQSLDDPDVSIRMRALDLVTNMVDRDNLQHIADQLLAHLAPEPPVLPSATASLRAISSPSESHNKDPTAIVLSDSPAYRLLVTQKLLAIIGQDTYQNVIDFEWVISILVDVGTISHVPVGEALREMLLDVVGRVKSIRERSVKILERVLGDEVMRETAREAKEDGEQGVLEAAIWICGEYPQYLTSPLSAINHILTPSLIQDSPQTISTSLQSASKIFAYHCGTSSQHYSSDTHETTTALATSVHTGISPFLSHGDIEVQERAFEVTQLLKFVIADLKSYNPPPDQSLSLSKRMEVHPDLQGGFEQSSQDDEEENQGGPSYPKSLFLFPPLFSGYQLNALGYKAQDAVLIPEGLDLGRDIVPGGGFLDIDNLDGGGLESAEEEEEGVDGGRMELGEGGGKGMEELRRVLREQEGKKGKGKKKKKGEVMTEEELAERAKRKAERKANQKDNPFYLGNKDDDEENVDVDDIPIVRLDLSDLPEAAEGGEEVSTSRTKTKSKSKKTKSTVPPPEIDRNGELPEGAAPISTLPPANSSRPGTSRTGSGLAAVDLLAPNPSSGPGSRSHSFTGRFEEYKDDDNEEKQRTSSRITEKEDIPAAQEVEVVRVKRKKKKKVTEGV